MTIRLDMPELQDALSKTPAAAAALKTETLRRYYLGELPTPLLWAIQHPKIASALLAVSRRLTDEERAEIKAATARKPRTVKAAPKGKKR